MSYISGRSCRKTATHEDGFESRPKPVPFFSPASTRCVLGPLGLSAPPSLTDSMVSGTKQQERSLAAPSKKDGRTAKDEVAQQLCQPASRPASLPAQRKDKEDRPVRVRGDVKKRTGGLHIADGLHCNGNMAAILALRRAGIQTA